MKPFEANGLLFRCVKFESVSEVVSFCLDLAIVSFHLPFTTASSLTDTYILCSVYMLGTSSKFSKGCHLFGEVSVQ